MGRANWQQKETDEILLRWKSKAEAEEGGDALANSYSRCALLQLKDEKTDGEDSPWSSPGHLRCEKRAQLASYIKEETRPRAASDVPAPTKPTKGVTIKLHNVPHDLSRTGLCEKLAEHGFGYAIDFLYLPAVESETSRQNKGHAFVNLRTKDAYRDFCLKFDGVPSSNCLPSVSSSDEPCKVSLAETQGRDLNYRELVTPCNTKKWAKHEDRQPLFLDDYGQRMPLLPPAQGGGYTSNADVPVRVRSASDSCQTLKADSPEFVPHENFKLDAPAFIPQPQVKPPGSKAPAAESTMKADSPAFVPQSSTGSTRCSPSLGPADSPEFVPGNMASPSLRAEAKEFVPMPSAPGLSLLPEAAIDADTLEPLEVSD